MHLPGEPLLLGLWLMTILFFVCVLRHRTQDKQDKDVSASAKSEARFSALVEHSSDVIVITDAALRMRFVSQSAHTVFGHSPSSMLNRAVARTLHPDDAPRVISGLEALAQQPNGASARLVGQVLHADGTWRHAEIVATNLLGEPAVEGIVLNTRDITERVQLESQLSHQAFHDPLTHLANRVLFRDRLEHALERESRTEKPRVAVLFLDLDDFKAINDSFGHTLGDELLVTVAQRLLNATRGCDTVARLGGDEFAILLENAGDIASAVTVAERVINAFAAPVQLGDTGVQVRTSIGIAMATPDDHADELLRNADVAMYRAKQNGKGTYTVFAQEMQSAVRDRLELESALRDAIDHNELRLLYQPIVDLKTEGLYAVEALVRWPHPRRGVIAPASFVPLAEETGLIVPLGRWVLREACRQGARWQADRSLPPITVSVNISARQLAESGFATDVAVALAASGLEPSRLQLEITESIVMRDTAEVIAILKELKGLGVSLAIDDFGTGYSSLSYLQRLPIDVLKIDKAFVDGIMHGGSEAALTKSIVALGNTLSLKMVAEGIELREQHEQLRALGCQYGQGFLFSRPVDAEEIPRLAVAKVESSVTANAA